MTLQEQTEAAKQLEELWTALMPDFPAPHRSQFLVWAGRDTLEVASVGINRAAAKRLSQRDTPMSLDSVVRYASGVMRNVRADLLSQSQNEAGRRRAA